jgi:hypothetical protein
VEGERITRARKGQQQEDAMSISQIEVPIACLTVGTLRSLCKAAGIPYVTRDRKADLLARIKAHPLKGRRRNRRFAKRLRYALRQAA